MTLPDTIKGEPDFTRENFREAMKTIEKLENKVYILEEAIKRLDRRIDFTQEIVGD